MISKEGVGVDISNDHLKISYLKATPFNTKICAHAVYDLDAALGFDEKMRIVGHSVDLDGEQYVMLGSKNNHGRRKCVGRAFQYSAKFGKQWELRRIYWSA